MLGEDGLEDAFGGDVTATLWLEALNGAEWDYAPCSIGIVPKPTPEERADDTDIHYYEEALLEAEFDVKKGWDLKDRRAEIESAVQKCLRQRYDERRREALQAEAKAMPSEKIKELLDIFYAEGDEYQQEWMTRTGCGSMDWDLAARMAFTKGWSTLAEGEQSMDTHKI
jgi:hypothetical protein